MTGRATWSKARMERPATLLKPQARHAECQLVVEKLNKVPANNAAARLHVTKPSLELHQRIVVNRTRPVK